MTDSSDCESDAGASPSISSDESSYSSEASSTTGMAASKSEESQKKSGGGVAMVTNSRLSEERKLIRRRQNSSNDISRNIRSSRGSQSDSNTKNKPSSSSAGVTSQNRKRKRTENNQLKSPQRKSANAESERKKKRNKRRRTRSERNILAGKTATTPSGTKSQVVTEGEEEVALDAEIDRVLEEKANKNNLSATNVKSIIRHVITNNMVQKMIMSSAMKKKAEAADAASSDDDCLVGPKMTRAKAKELLLDNRQLTLWPNVYPSPKKTVSETHKLFQHDLPEDSSGDEEYIPKEQDISEMIHSDDESSSVTSHASDIGSPAPPTPEPKIVTRRKVQSVETPSSSQEHIFKTPPPRKPGMMWRGQEESAISRRTRNKCPLKDTRLEDLEQNLVDPDFEPDMYDWGNETDNEDYLDFLKDFLKPPDTQNETVEVDDEADPEYNVMEDEDVHDREELRRDRAVKVPKKELTELIAELFEPGGMDGWMGEEDFDDNDLTTLSGITPLVSDSSYVDTSVLDTSSVLDTPQSAKHNKTNGGMEATVSSNRGLMDFDQSALLRMPVANTSGSSIAYSNSKENASIITLDMNQIKQLTEMKDVVDSSNVKAGSSRAAATTAGSILSMPNLDSSAELPSPAGVATVTDCQRQEMGEPVTASAAEEVVNPENQVLFREEDLKLLQHQMRQHIQLLAQSYVLTTSCESSSSKNLSHKAKGMVNEFKRFAANGPTSSVFKVCNLEPAWNIVNFWPHKFLQQSPIKKKILEEKYISEFGQAPDDNGFNKMTHFPRHVVKIIVENPAFLFNELLPECYLQSNKQSRCTFSFHEDALLVNALEDLKHIPKSKSSTDRISRLISEHLLVARTPNQLYNRLRNLRKSSTHYCNPAIQEYFESGTLPEVDHSFVEITAENAKPLIRRDRTGLSKLWQSLIQNFEESSTYKWEETLDRDPITKSIKLKWNRRYKPKQKGIDANSPELVETIDQVFPNGTYQIENTNPDLEAIPFLNAQGKPGAIIYVPKYLVNSNPPPVTHKLKSPMRPHSGQTSTSMCGGELYANQPKEAQQAEPGFQDQPQSLVQTAAEALAQLSSSTLSFAGAQQHVVLAIGPKPPLIASPKKAICNNFSPIKQFLPPPQLQLAPSNTVGYHVVQPVGKPFNLNELGYNFPVGNEHVIDMSTLRTPLKAKIFEKATEMEVVEENEQVPQEGSPSHTVNISPVSSHSGVESECGSPDVILEGTEEELSDDDDEEEGNERIENNQQETPDVVDLLSSSDEEKEKPTQRNQKGGVKVVAGGSGNSGEDNKGSHQKSEGDSKQSNESSGTGAASSHSQSSVLAQSTSSSISRRVGSRPGKGDDSDDDENKERRGKKRDLPDDYNKDGLPVQKQNEDDDSGSSPEKEKPVRKYVTTTCVPSSSPGTSQKLANTSNSQQLLHSSSTNVNKSLHQPHPKKAKRSPGNQQVSNRRASKYNVASGQKLLDDTEEDYEDATDSYMEWFLTRVAAVSEESNPGLYNSFIQILMDAGMDNVNQPELHRKVKVLFKDYPELLAEFESLLDPSLDQSDLSNTNVAGPSSHQGAMAQIDFLQKMEKLTENCPQLKSKVFNKLKSLREKPNLSERDIANALEHFFVGNPVMMEAFKALLPEVYRPQSSSTDMDFEEIDLEMEDPPRDNEDLHFETVKLPEETNVPATNTCPCICHNRTSDLSVASRSKHCRKCSLKFQDGKIFIHNGKMLRPVSVELSPSSSPTKPASSSSSSSAPISRPINNVSASANPEPRPKKESHHSSTLSTSKPTEFKEPEASSKVTEKKLLAIPQNSHPQTHSFSSGGASTSKASAPSRDLSSVVVTESGEASTSTKVPILAPSSIKSEDKVTAKSSPLTKTDNEVNSQPKQNSQHSSNIESTGQEEDSANEEWTEEEDTVILEICKEEPSENVALTKMASQLPHRKFEQVKNRFDYLMELLRNAEEENLI